MYNVWLLSSFRPISSFLFISKILEKVEILQLQPFLNTPNISEVFQSGFKANHSTESALLNIFIGIFLTIGFGDSVILVLFHFTAAFDALDYNVLISHLEQHVRRTALEWLKLSDRSFSVSYGKCPSSLATFCGIAEGFIMGLFFLVLTELCY